MLHRKNREHVTHTGKLTLSIPAALPTAASRLWSPRLPPDPRPLCRLAVASIHVFMIKYVQGNPDSWLHAHTSSGSQT